MANSPTQREIIIPKGYSDDERRSIAEDIVGFIVERTKKGRGMDGEKFPKYSPSYIDSIAFRSAGKSKSKVDLTLSGEMLDELDVVKTAPGKLVIGYGKNSSQAGKAEGNILGTYGTDTPDESRARDFLALSQNELNKILKDYPIERTTQARKSRRDSTQDRQNIRELSNDIIDRLQFEE